MHWDTKDFRYSAFGNCISLKSLRLPESVEIVGTRAFSNCIKLEVLELNSGLKRISGWAFLNCLQLEQVTIPSTVVNIGTNAFSLNDGLLHECRHLDGRIVRMRPSRLRSPLKNTHFLVLPCKALTSLPVSERLEKEHSTVSDCGK